MPDLTLIPWGSGAVWALGIALKGTIVLLLAVLAATALHRASAGLRHLVWGGGIISVLGLPMVSLAVPWRLAVVSVPRSLATPALPRAAAPVLNAGEPEGAGPGHSGAATDQLSPSTAAPSGGSLVPWLLAVWGAGALFLLARLGVGAVLLRRVVRGATPLDSPDWTRPLIEGADRLAVERLPRLLTSDRVPMPVVCGILRPAIVVPSDAGEWTDRRRRAVLCHELAHIRRFDLPVNLLGRLVCAFHWFNPLVWVAARRLRVESERACDDLVLGIGTRPSEYADHLLQIVCGARRGLAPAVAIPMAQRREFEGRMLAILERDARRAPPSRRHTAGLAALALLLLLPIAAIGPAQEPSAYAASAAEPSRPARRPKFGRISPRLLAALLEDLDATGASRRQDAANTLGLLRTGDAVGALAVHLRSDPDAYVRETAAWALGRIGSPEATEPLSAAARSDASEAVRALAVWSLGQITDPATLSTLEAALADADGPVRRRAAWAIGTIAPRRAPAALLAALRDSDPTVREAAAWALGQTRDPAAVPGLAAALRDTRSKASFEAQWALARIGGETARPHLTDVLSHVSTDSKLRGVIAKALAGDSVPPRPWPWPMPSVR